MGCTHLSFFFPPPTFAGDFKSELRGEEMKKFNIRKVLDGLKEASSSSSSSTPSVQVGPQENNLIQETLQSEHFQLCKVGETSDSYQLVGTPAKPSCLCAPFYFFVWLALIPFQDAHDAGKLQIII